MWTRVWLAIDDLAIFIAAVAFCFYTHAPWYVFALMALAPDIGMLGYLAGNKIGAICYNAVHIYAVPLVIGCFGLANGSSVLQAVALVWIAHIAWDRMLGFGLKTPRGFKFTHLGSPPDNLAESGE
jgi:hypothetical protein